MRALDFMEANRKSIQMYFGPVQSRKVDTVFVAGNGLELSNLVEFDVHLPYGLYVMAKPGVGAILYKNKTWDGANVLFDLEHEVIRLENYGVKLDLPYRFEDLKIVDAIDEFYGGLFCL